MISTEYVQTMARYNAWQNDSLVAAADGLSEADRTRDRGAFFGSIMGTFSHLLWGDAMWMSRFDGGTAPGVGIPESSQYMTDWSEFRARRVRMDARIKVWARAPGDLSGQLAWFSGAVQRDVERPLALCVTHFFNHQTHHRGQIHAMLTAAGAWPDDTDLPFLPDAAA